MKALPNETKGPASQANRQRLLTRSAQTLLGICTGLAADGTINNTEIHFLRTWLTENSEVLESWPGSIIGQRLEIILADGTITEEERQHFLETLQSITGNSFHETGSAGADSPALPTDPDATIHFDKRTFCFTGTFLYGTRGACEWATQNLGGVTLKAVTQSLDYLVIGAMVTKDWAYESYGRKIEKAATLRQKGGKIRIVTEQQWAAAMKSITL